ncbi:hypothetical protein ACH4FX_32270 [Streptomyces sp. NPDC018019]|uniref:hypothetical protein n=1 Tax=Streptomyces sp. NPDC018019 TaxID=3365030 RepID=UPI00378DC2E0
MPAYTLATPDTTYPRPRAAVTFDGAKLARPGRFVEASPEAVLPWITALTGNQPAPDRPLRTLGQLAEEQGAQVEDMMNLCQQLNDAGYIWLAPPDGVITIEEFRGEFRFWVRRWVRKMFDHPVWTQVGEGTADRRVLIGWAKECADYTGSVIRHMTRAAANAEDSAEGWTLLTHNSQEWDHYALFEGACLAAGMPDDTFVRIPPLRSTVAVTHLMRRIARRHPLVYNACEAMLEATAERPQRVVDFYTQVQKHYGYPEGFIQPIIDHLHVDADFEHIDIFDGLISGLEVIPFALVTEILEACHELADSMHVWHAHIAAHYSRPDTAVA